MKRASPLNYIFAVAKIRALEKFLIKQEVFQEAVESSLDESLRLFVESDLYSEELLHIRDSRQLEEALSKELARWGKIIQGLILDKGLLGLLDFKNLSEAKEITKAYKSEFLNDYILHLIDMYNIKTFLRLYILKEPKAKLNAILVHEGFLKKEFFLKFYQQDLAIFLNRLEYVHKGSQIIDYASVLREPIQKLQQENSFVALEKAINDFLIQVLKPAKYISFGPEPLLAYYFAKVNEINLIRLIILAKLNNVSGDLVKERLNGVYA